MQHDPQRSMRVKHYRVIEIAKEGLRWSIIELTNNSNAREVARFYNEDEAHGYADGRRRTT